jgi:ABC-type uncharacterized transport system ATPase subunit
MRMRDITNGGAELSVSQLSSGVIKHASDCLLSTYKTRNISNLTTEASKEARSELSSSSNEVDQFSSMVSAALDRRWLHLKSLLKVGESWVMSRLSSGQKARVQLCLQLLLPTRVILMDEVTIVGVFVTIVTF